MPRFLSPEWLELQRSLASTLPVRPGATARLQIVVTGGPDGDVIYTQVIEDGQLVASVLGADDSADVTLTQAYPDAVAIAKGELDANAAFMQGRVKVVGNMGALMAVMPLTQSTDYQDLVTALAADTEF